ncbi:hypothetical protein BJ165DRAFT_653900 [Panaeolus papilionaceus]|nr:hypothetical protein BJ165DRAFT_653900 [Panaeolus papilionaceus]
MHPLISLLCTTSPELDCARYLTCMPHHDHERRYDQSRPSKPHGTVIGVVGSPYGQTTKLVLSLSTFAESSYPFRDVGRKQHEGPWRCRITLAWHRHTCTWVPVVVASNHRKAVAFSRAPTFGKCLGHPIGNVQKEERPRSKPERAFIRRLMLDYVKHQLGKDQPPGSGLRPTSYIYP